MLCQRENCNLVPCLLLGLISTVAFARQKLEIIVHQPVGGNSWVFGQQVPIA